MGESGVTFAGQFNDLGVNDGPHSIHWDFADGTVLTDVGAGSLTAPSYRYSQSGEYVVTLTIAISMVSFSVTLQPDGRICLNAAM